MNKDDNMHGEIDHGNYFGRGSADGLGEKDKKSNFMADKS
jgi:hypothetical protein